MILSPQRLPFRHPGVVLTVNRLGFLVGFWAADSVVKYACMGGMLCHCVYIRIYSNDAADSRDVMQKLGKNVYAIEGRNFLYCVAMVKGKRIFESLKIEAEGVTQDRLRLAEKRAALRVRSAREGDVELIMAGRARSEVPTVGKVIEWFREFAGVRDLAKRTVGSYVSSTRCVLKECKFAAWRDARVSVLTPKLATDYVRRCLAAAGEPEGVARQAVVNSAQSRLADVAGLFSKMACRYYEQMGYKCPAVDFGPSPFFPVRAKVYVLPPSDLVNKTMGALASDRESRFWGAFCLCFWLACRGSEAVHARADWLVGEGDGVFLEIKRREGFRMKGRPHRKRVPAGLAVELKRLAEANDGYILPGSYPRHRVDLVQRELSEFMRRLGWEAAKWRAPVHELRKLMGNHIYHAVSASAAKAFLGHGSIATTETSYAENTPTPEALVSWFEFWGKQ